MSSLPTNDDEDSDLEIVPNPPPQKGPLVDLSTNPENDKHVQLPSYDRNTNNSSNSRKRSIKPEFTANLPPAKKRKAGPDTKPLPIKTQEKDVSKKSVNIKQQHRKKCGPNNYHFWGAHSGLYYAGNCFNSSCVAFREPVTAPRGYGVIKPLEDQQHNNIRCPGCDTTFQLKAIHLMECTATIYYQLRGETRKTKNLSRIPNGDYVVLGPVVKQVTENQDSTKHKASRSTSNITNAETNEENYVQLEFQVRRLL
eukprot:251477_1